MTRRSTSQMTSASQNMSQPTSFPSVFAQQSSNDPHPPPSVHILPNRAARSKTERFSVVSVASDLISDDSGLWTVLLSTGKISRITETFRRVPLSRQEFPPYPSSHSNPLHISNNECQSPAFELPCWDHTFREKIPKEGGSLLWKTVRGMTSSSPDHFDRHAPIDSCTGNALPKTLKNRFLCGISTRLVLYIMLGTVAVCVNFATDHISLKVVKDTFFPAHRVTTSNDLLFQFIPAVNVRPIADLTVVLAFFVIASALVCQPERWLICNRLLW